MNNLLIKSLLLICLSVITSVVSVASISDDAQSSAATIEKIHFLIPGGAGGGWDMTARGTGEALTKAGLVQTASYQNMSGGGGGKAIAHLIETAARQQDTLLVNSSPIVGRSLTKVFPQSFRDLTPIAAVIGDYGSFVVPMDSPFKLWSDVVAVFKENPRKVKVAGGSVRGSTDHLVAAMAFKAAGADPRRVVYISYDAGGKAMAGLLSGEAHILSTGLSEGLELAKAGQVRILAITADQRSSDASEVPTLKEQGYDAVFINWRGFFGPPNLSQAKVQAYTHAFKKMYQTDAWQTVRQRNGWVNLYRPSKQFYRFLESQEKTMGGLMRELGFLKEF